MTTNKPAVMAQIGENIRQLRLEKGFTQEFIAEAADINEKNLSALENGRLENVSIGYLIDIAEVLGVNYKELLPD